MSHPKLERITEETLTPDHVERVRRAVLGVPRKNSLHRAILGFSATLRQRTNHTPKKDGSLGLYWYVIIGGNTHLIPTRILRKRAQDYKRQKVATRTGFAPRPIGQGAYYGFALDGDGRFLLGDFTVTHSTVRSLGTSVPVSRAQHGVDRSALGARIPRFSRRTLTAATTRHAARNERLA